MASGIYTPFKVGIGQGTHQLQSGGNAFKVALMTSGHSFTATHQYWADTSANEITGTGYTSGGGAALAGQSWGSTGSTCVWDATDTAWTVATFSAHHAVVFNDTVAQDPLVCSFDFSSQSVVAGTFTIQWNSSGILRMA